METLPDGGVLGYVEFHKALLPLAKSPNKSAIGLSENTSQRPPPFVVIAFGPATLLVKTVPVEMMTASVALEPETTPLRVIPAN